MSGLSFAAGNSMALEREIETYRRKLGELLSHKGELVLIHGDDVIGFFTSMESALRAGYERFGEEAFLIREVTDKEKVLVSSRSVRLCRSSQAP